MLLTLLPWVPTLVMKPLMNTMMFNCRSGAYNDASRVRRVCVYVCVTVYVCVRLVCRVGVFFLLTTTYALIPLVQCMMYHFHVGTMVQW